MGKNSNELQNELSFKLSKPLKVSINGKFEETHELILTAPSMKDRKAAAKLKQVIARAQTDFMGKFSQEQMDSFKDVAEGAGVKDDDSGESLKSIITGSDQDLEDFYAAFDTLALRVCTVVDGVSLKRDHLEEMELVDYDRMCFEYVGNFIE